MFFQDLTVVSARYF